jgi:Na+-translocating ferredoxin:NAD+ oxidoreductase RnfD subunit
MTASGRQVGVARPRSGRRRQHASGFEGRLRHFLRTPKGLLLAVLTMLLAIAGRVEGLRSLMAVLAACGTAAGLDVLVVRWCRRRWIVPDGALLTGLLVAAVLTSREAWWVFAGAAAIAIVSKHALRVAATNVLNPAAVGLVAASHVLNAVPSWWGALASIHPASAWPLLVGTGGITVRRVRRWPLAVAFLAVYFALFAVATFVVDPAEVAEAFVPPDLYAAVFFACFMLTDPPTSPAREPAQIVHGALVACASVGIFLAAGAADYLVIGVLVGNLVEAFRRWRVRRPLRGR